MGQSKSLEPVKPSVYDEHIFTPIPGSTAMRCSCGKEYATTGEQQQHLQWHLALVSKSSEPVCAKTNCFEPAPVWVLSGMGNLCARHAMEWMDKNAEQMRREGIRQHQADYRRATAALSPQPRLKQAEPADAIPANPEPVESLEGIVTHLILQAQLQEAKAARTFMGVNNKDVVSLGVRLLQSYIESEKQKARIEELDKAYDYLFKDGILEVEPYYIKKYWNDRLGALKENKNV